jgi:hypothetical protein
MSRIEQRSHPRKVGCVSNNRGGEMSATDSDFNSDFTSGSFVALGKSPPLPGGRRIWCLSRTSETMTKE